MTDRLGSSSSNSHALRLGATTCQKQALPQRLPMLFGEAPGQALGRFKHGQPNPLGISFSPCSQRGRSRISSRWERVPTSECWEVWLCALIGRSCSHSKGHRGGSRWRLFNAGRVNTASKEQEGVEIAVLGAFGPADEDLVRDNGPSIGQMPSPSAPSRNAITEHTYVRCRE
jgi:hypothetical protein